MNSIHDMLHFMKWDKIFSLVSKKNSTLKNGLKQQSTNQNSELPSLNLAFDLTREHLKSQFERANALDTKANFALSAATGIISAALVLQSLLLQDHSNSNCSVLIPEVLYTLPLLLRRAIPLLPLLISYLVVMITAFSAYKIRTLYQVPDPRVLLMEYVRETEAYSKALLFRFMIEACEENERELLKKAKFINIAFITLVVQSIALVSVLFYQVIC